MCSICGGNLKKEQVEKASRLMAHRGRDSSGIYADSQITLAHNRLAIIDLSKSGNQPMKYGNLVIILNGEIYNYRELKEELKALGEEFVGSSDTEVLLHALAHYGLETTLEKLNGMFAFALYDECAKKLILARDHFGKKPLYYYYNSSTFLFASEIKAILAMLETTPPPCMQALDEYLHYLAPCGENSAFEGIKKIPAGCYGIYDFESGDFQRHRYYTLIGHIAHNPEESQEKARNRVLELLEESLKYRLISDVKVASFLSGGLDSSLLSALYARLSGAKIETFSIGYDEFSEYSELPFAREVSEHIRSHHHEIVASETQFLEAFEAVCAISDEPINDPALIPTFLLSQEVAQAGFKVVLSGEGSDELFFGYRDYYRYLDFLRSSTVISDKEARYKQRQKCGDSPYFRVINETWQEENPWNVTIPASEYFPNLFRESGLSEGGLWCSYADFSHWIPEVLMNKMDRMSMAHSLESRAPFLDVRLVEYVLGLSENARIGREPKGLLKEIARDFIPASIIKRNKKGFSSPMFEWYFAHYKERILGDYLRFNKECGWFRNDFLHFLYNEGRIGRLKSQNWAMIMLSRWFLKYFG
ncbi:MAG: asparagine synthase (glutamine-hydrolyzing) [Wolinella sp.]